MSSHVNPIARLRATLARSVGWWLRTHYATPAKAIEALAIGRAPGPEAWAMRLVVKAMFTPDLDAWEGRGIVAHDERICALDTLFAWLRRRGVNIYLSNSIIKSIQQSAHHVDAQLDAYGLTAKANSFSTTVDPGAKKLASRRKCA